MQLKLSAIGNPHRQLSIPASSVGGHWIVKLPSPAYPGLPENEFSMMEFARMVGIQVPEIGLIPLDKIPGIRSLGSSLKETPTTSGDLTVDLKANASTSRTSISYMASSRKPNTRTIAIRIWLLIYGV